MKSIADSVHRVLANQIVNLGLESHYTVEKARIIGTNGTEFVFAGLKHNIDNIKSLEACDIAWVEEAANVSRGSWDKLIPTIRKAGSEIWVSMNPEMEQDDSFQRFILNPPPDAVVVKIGYEDNPWASAVLKPERDALRLTDIDAYNHIWGGQCRRMLEGSIYANELRAAESEGRIRKVAYDPTRPVHTFWDLGWGDSTAIWFAQAFMAEYRLIDYMEDSGKPLQHYLGLMQNKGYLYGEDWLPWDVCSKVMAKSLEEQMRSLGRKVRILPKTSVHVGIDAARTIFPNCWFDAEKTADGLTALRYYRYGESKTLGTPTREPLHDDASHGSDAFRYFAMGIRQPKPEKAPPPVARRPAAPPTAWS